MRLTTSAGKSYGVSQGTMRTAAESGLTRPVWGTRHWAARRQRRSNTCHPSPLTTTCGLTGVADSEVQFIAR